MTMCERQLHIWNLSVVFRSTRRQYEENVTRWKYVTAAGYIRREKEKLFLAASSSVPSRGFQTPESCTRQVPISCYCDVRPVLVEGKMWGFAALLGASVCRRYLFPGIRPSSIIANRRRRFANWTHIFVLRSKVDEAADRQCAAGWLFSLTTPITETVSSPSKRAQCARCYRVCYWAPGSAALSSLQCESIWKQTLTMTGQEGAAARQYVQWAMCADLLSSARKCTGYSSNGVTKLQSLFHVITTVKGKR